MKIKLILVIIMVFLCICGLIYVDKICATDNIYAGGGRNTFTEEEALELVFINISSKFPDIEECEVIEPLPIKEPEIEIIDLEEVKSYTEEEYELLAHLIFAEAGSDWCSDKMQQYTGSVVLNRIASKYYPNNMYDVIYQKGQYSVTKSGAINKTPNQRAYDCAKFLLENGSVLPANVIFQSQHVQGDGIYEKVQNMYFCYKN